jgi:hypothetical protein
MINSFKDVIAELGGPAKFGRLTGMGPGAAKQAQRRDSIAAKWFSATARVAQEGGLSDITEARLAEMAANRTGPVA